MNVFIKALYILICIDLVHMLNMFRNLNSRRIGEVELELTSTGKDERTKRATALPGTLSFQFQVGGDKVSLNLEKNKNVGVDTPVFLHRQGEAVRLGSTGHKGKDVAFYQDVTKGASIMVRRQLQMENMYELMGTYYVEDNQYSIEPIPASKETISGTFNHTISILTEHLNLKDDIINFGSYEFPQENTLNRYKRQLHINNKYTVELLMVIDHAIYKTWYDGINESDPARRREKTLETIKQYYAFVLNGIDVRYATIQEPDLTIDVVFAGILIFDDEQDSYLSTSNLLPGQLVESSDALETFRQWVLSNMTSLPPSDHVMLFTGFNLTYGGSTSNAGLAYLKSICNHEYFFSIVEEYFEFRVISIAAHELGHSLGARHDMDENTCLSFQLYIMTSRFKFPSKSKAANPYRFSKCSIQYFKDFIFSLKDLGLHCLKTQDSMKDVKEISGYLVQQPGETYTADTQCQNSHGDNSYVCRWCMNGTCIEDASVNRLADDCPFGDLPGTVRSNETCHDVITQSPWECYEERMRLNCCDSCFYKHSSVQGCEYGDRVFDCVKEQCNDYNETTRSVDCCETCSDVPFPTRPTRTTTTPSPTTTFTLTTTVVPITTFTDTSKVIPTTTSASTLKETSTNSLAEPITPADNYIKPTTPNNVKPVVTMVKSRSYHQTTSPSPQSVTSNVDQVTTLYDVGGVTFKSSDQIAPTDLTLRDSNPDNRRLTSTSSRTNPTNNYYRNRNWDPNSVTSAPLAGKLTTSGYVTQNEKPTLGHTPPRGTTKFKPRYDQDSTSERSHENGNGGQPGIATIANNYLNLKNQNIDMTSSSQLRPRDETQRWLNDFLATRLTSRNIGDRNSANERHEGESYEDVNTSGGLSEEDIHGNSGSAWRRRVLNHRHHNTPDSEPVPIATRSGRDKAILINILLHLIRQQTTEISSSRSFPRISRMSEEDDESPLWGSDKVPFVLKPRDTASESKARHYYARNILDYLKLWKTFTKSTETENRISESNDNRPSTLLNNENLAASPIDQDLDSPFPDDLTTSGYSSNNQSTLEGGNPQIDDTIQDANKAFDDTDHGAATNRDVDASKIAEENSRFDIDSSKEKNLDQKTRKDFTTKIDNTEHSYSGPSLKSRHHTRRTTLFPESTPQSANRLRPPFRPHNPFCQKNHVRSHTTIRHLRSDDPQDPTLRSDARQDPTLRSLGSDPRRNPIIRSLGWDPRRNPNLRSLGSNPRPSPTMKHHGSDARHDPILRSLQPDAPRDPTISLPSGRPSQPVDPIIQSPPNAPLDTVSDQSLNSGDEKNAKNRDWIHVTPKGLTSRRKKIPGNGQTRKRENERTEGMSDEGEMEDEYCSMCGANNNMSVVGVCMLPADCSNAGWNQGSSVLCVPDKGTVCCYKPDKNENS